MLRVPAYDAFLDETDFTPAYVWQKRFMQRANSNGHARWVLKAPDHAYSLDALFKVFPDAIIIQTHRAPMEVIKSATRLAYVVRKPFSDALDLEQIAPAEAEALQKKISKITRFRDTRPELAGRFIDVTYHKLTSEPLKMIEEIYERLHCPLGENARHQMQRLAMRSGRYSQHALSSQLRATRADQCIDAGQFAGYSEQLGLS